MKSGESRNRNFLSKKQEFGIIADQIKYWFFTAPFLPRTLILAAVAFIDRLK
jgi:hypothetical protein